MNGSALVQRSCGFCGVVMTPDELAQHQRKEHPTPTAPVTARELLERLDPAHATHTVVECQIDDTVPAVALYCDCGSLIAAAAPSLKRASLDVAMCRHALRRVPVRPFA